MSSQPHITTSSKKRKVPDESDTQLADKKSKPSRISKTNSSQNVDAETEENASYPSQPTNLVLPTPVVLEKAAEGVTRIAIWNICGLSAASKKVNVLNLFYVQFCDFLIIGV
jgi:AP endonuclease 1